MQAEKYLRSYLANVPSNSESASHASAHEWLGKLYEYQGKLDQASAEYQAAVNLDPRNKTLREELKHAQQHK
jgi:tetratricopeptide (TPR) repeat protein